MKYLFANADAGMAGLIFFFLFFCGILIWVLRPGAKQKLEAHGNIPLEDDKND